MIYDFLIKMGLIDYSLIIGTYLVLSIMYFFLARKELVYFSVEEY